MNIYSCYTPSHKKMYWKYFQNSVCFDVSVVSYLLPEIGNGNYKNEHWIEATKHKIVSILEIIDLQIDDIFIFSDVDVQFFGPITDFITDSIVDYDIVAQNDPSLKYDQMYCTGFMAIRNTPSIRDLFQNALNLMETEENLDDQDAFNMVVNGSSTKIGLFDQDAVWSHRKMWQPGTELKIPDNILVHHANWTFSVEHKEAQLEEVLEIYRSIHGDDYLQHRTSNYRDRGIMETQPQ